MGIVKNWIILLVIIGISSYSSFSFSFISAEDSIALEVCEGENTYEGVAKSVVLFLESQNSPNYLSSFITEKWNVPIDFNQAKLLDFAATMYGLTEIVGDSNNQQILNFFGEIGHPEINTDEMSWCSSYLGWCTKQLNLNGSTALLARSWLEVGLEIADPQVGDLVIFWRETPNSWQGHVAIYLNKNPLTNEIYCLGGNQDDKVCVKSYPANQLLGYRRLSEIK
jgi:uncharacterized protein (TIGR02594 family)